MSGRDLGFDEPPSALVSYSHRDRGWTRRQAEVWRATVLGFATLLCEMGIDAELDQFHEHDLDVDWNRFGVDAVQNLDFVLLAVSSAYRERWEGRNNPTEGAGTVREVDELLGQFNEDQSRFRKRVKVVVLPGATVDDIPVQLRGLNRFQLDELTEEAMENLYRTLTGQPAAPKPKLGPLRPMPPRGIGADHAQAVHAADEDATESRQDLDLQIDLARINANLFTMPPEVRREAEFGEPIRPVVRAARELLAERDAILRQLATSRAMHLGRLQADSDTQLTEREMAVLRFMPTMLSNREIAEELLVSVNTVKTHIRQIYTKLGAQDRRDAVRLARRAGLLPVPDEG